MRRMIPFFFQLVSCVRLNAMHTVFSLWNSENQLRQASSEAIQLCAEEAEFRPTIRYNDDSSIMKDKKNRVPASDAQEATDMLSA